jgi:hypothetical protein
VVLWADGDAPLGGADVGAEVGGANVDDLVIAGGAGISADAVADAEGLSCGAGDGAMAIAALIVWMMDRNPRVRGLFFCALREPPKELRQTVFSVRPF